MIQPVMLETYEQLLTYVGTSTALVPGLLAFSIGSRSSLKSWLAVQQAPPAPRLNKDVEKSMKRKLMAVWIVTLFSILGLELYLFSVGNEATIDRFFTYLFGYIFQISSMALFVEFTQAIQWSVHRGAAGILQFRPRHVSKARLFVATAAATALNLASYFDAHWVFGSTLVVAVLVSRLSNAPARTFSLRGSIFVTLIVVAFLSVISGLAIFAVAKLNKQYEDGELPSNPDDESEPVGFASPYVMKYMNPFMMAVYSMIPGTLIAGCFRFDYSNAVEASPETFGPVSLENVEAPVCKVGYLSSGVVLPSSVPNSFAKPYYTVALWSWLLAQFAVTGFLSLALPTLPREMLGIYSFLSLYLSSIFLVIAVVMTSVFRGEAKKMWTYKEVWVPKAEKGIVLEGEEGASSPIEQLPAYEAPVVVDADVKEPLVAPHQVTDNKV